MLSNDSTKQFVVLEGIKWGNRFFTTNDPTEGEKVRYSDKGSLWYNILGYADTALECQEFLFGKSMTESPIGGKKNTYLPVQMNWVRIKRRVQVFRHRWGKVGMFLLLIPVIFVPRGNPNYVFTQLAFWSWWLFIPCGLENYGGWFKTRTFFIIRNGLGFGVWCSCIFALFQK